MGALRAVASARVSRAGGAKHLAYISRLEALRPDRPGEETRDERGAAPVFEHHLDNGGAEVKGASAAQPEKEASREAAHAGKDNESSLREADAIYTWNAPAYVTGDSYGTRDERSDERRKARLEQGLRLAGVAAEAERPGEGRLTLEDKAERALAYFGLLSDSEKKRGGVNSYRVVLTVGGEVGERDMRGAVNEFLRETFPKAQALVAIHHNTEHVHAHVYVHSRQLDGTKVNLKQDYFRLDEKWARVCAEHFHEPSIYEDHMRLKAETRRYRKEERQAREGRETLPDKPARWADRFEILRGAVRPWDDRYVGRLMAVGRVAEAKAGYLRVTGAAPSRLAAADQEARELRGKLKAVSAKRSLARSEAKRSLPAEIITIEERKELTLYSKAAAREAPTAVQKADAAKAPAVQASLDFGDPAPRQLELWSETLVTGKVAASPNRKGAKGSSAGTRKRGGKSEARAVGKTLPVGGGKEQSPGREQGKTMTESEVLGRAMVAGSEVGRIRAELARAREHGDKWRIKIYDATHKRERVISEFEIRLRCEALAKRAVEGRGVGDPAERREALRQGLDGELTKHRHGTSYHRKVVGNSIRALDEQLSVTTREYEAYGPRALEIQARYAAVGQPPPLPALTSAELSRLQDQVVAAKDSGRFLALESLREELAAERGEPARNDHELARLRGQFVAAGADLKASEHRREEFESGRHLEAWEVNGEAWSLTEVDRRINRLADKARVLADPYSLIPRLTDPVRQVARLAAKLGKNLNLSGAKRAEAARDVERLLEVRALVEGQVAA
ncbi:MAG TPA: relaxase/mobilization nuclease domain-containing protein, partial [Pyrinomonadaceae bacterium]|nr:relaxase/mobilization nuclease domain-containing protein [Pyrinomonadaceae bacterium]